MKVLMCGGMTVAGRRQCAAKVVKEVGGVNLCERHLTNLIRELGNAVYLPETVMPSAVVYYLGDPDSQTIKIGASKQVLRRLDEVQRRGKPNTKLLAVEPGYFTMEAMRHRQFASIRVDHSRNREWYHKTDEIMTLINNLRVENGDPWKHPALGQYGG